MKTLFTSLALAAALALTGCSAPSNLDANAVSASPPAAGEVAGPITMDSDYDGSVNSAVGMSSSGTVKPGGMVGMTGSGSWDGQTVSGSAGLVPEKEDSRLAERRRTNAQIKDAIDTLIKKIEKQQAKDDRRFQNNLRSIDSRLKHVEHRTDNALSIEKRIKALEDAASKTDDREPKTTTTGVIGKAISEHSTASKVDGSAKKTTGKTVPSSSARLSPTTLEGETASQPEPTPTLPPIKSQKTPVLNENIPENIAPDAGTGTGLIPPRYTVKVPGWGEITWDGYQHSNHTNNFVEWSGEPTTIEKGTVVCPPILQEGNGLGVSGCVVSMDGSWTFLNGAGAVQTWADNHLGGK